MKWIASVVTILTIASWTMAATISPVVVNSVSGRLGQTWLPEFSIDGDPVTFWHSELNGNPWIVYEFDQAYQVGDVSITAPGGGVRKLATAAVSVSTDGVNFTAVGDFPIDVADGAVTTFDLGGADARYVRVDGVEAFWTGWDPNYITPGNAPDDKYAVSIAEIEFKTLRDIAEAGPDQTVYDADDDGSEDVTLDGSASSYPGGSITAYDWTEGGVSIATGVNPTVTLAVGEHTIVLTVTTSDATTDSDTVVITVEGTPQSFANAGPDQVVIDTDDNGTELVTLDGTGSAWSTATWEWREGAAVLGTGATLQVSLAVGVHNITLYCTDLTGHNDTDDVVIDVRAGAQPPVADAGLDRTVMDVNDSGDELVCLDGSGSIDYDGVIVSWDWSEGGSTIATGESPQATFALGDHTVTLTVTDNEGRTDTDTVLIRVVAYAPSPTDAPCVGAWEADNLFNQITAEDMATIRSKKVLLASRSFGLNLKDGFNRLAGINSMYMMDVSTDRNDVNMEGPSALALDAFDHHNFVQYLASVWPWTARLPEFNDFVRNRYADELDAAIVFFHGNVPSTFAPYSATMDSLRLDYPGIQFIYVTAGVSPVSGTQENIDSNLFSDQVLATYRGQAPIYDMRDILSTHADGTACTFDSGGTTYRYMCPEFNLDVPHDWIHPNSPFSEERMGKAMVVLLYQMFVAQPATPGDADGDGDVDLDDFVILKSTWGQSPLTDDRADFDNDGDVDLDDFVILKSNWGS